MDLPVFNDNLKSSASWAAALDRERKASNGLFDSALVRNAQIEQMLKRAGEGIAADKLLEAAELVSSLAKDSDAEFDLGRFLDLHRTMIGAGAEDEILRKIEPLPINAMHDPTPAILVPRMLDNAFDWFGAQSFDELHPVEQSSIVFLRLLDLHPFPAHSEISAQLAASYYTERAGLPPLIIFADADSHARFAASLEAAFRMLTQPLVEFFAEMLMRTMRLGSKG